MALPPDAGQDDRGRARPQEARDDAAPARADPLGRAMALFDAYSDLSHEALKTALAGLQQSDPDACRELVGLLAADEQTHSFASPLRWFAARSQAAPGGGDIHADGTLFGPWRAEGILGIGGMGVIYAVRRADGLYEREAALKTVRAELSSPQLLDAFKLERNLLARLDHPAIVSLFDAGVTEDGQPWLAMQRVAGEHIDAWCDARSATLRARVELLVDVCEAIGYAHAHGILHQDIKPSNVLVTETGKVKLLDFGLSTMLARPGEDGAQRIGVSTAYAAPEIFRGAPASVAIDVHAIGVMFYRLLCAQWPRRASAMIGEAAHAQPPVEPSQRVATNDDATAQRRGCATARLLSDALRGDLDAIAMRCVADDPAERYASVSELRADLLAWLRGYAVAARNGGTGYRFGRFLQRHSWGVAVATVATIVAIAAVWFLLAQERNARIQAENDRALADLFRLSLVAATQNAQSGDRDNVSPLLRKSEQRLRATAGDGRREFLANGLASLAAAYYEQSDYTQAERLWREVLELQPEDPMLYARTASGLATLANKRMDLGELQRFSREGIAALHGRQDSDSVLQRTALQMSLARAYWLRDDAASALPVLDDAIRTVAALGPEHEAQWAGLVRQRGVIYSSIGRRAEAERDLSLALAHMSTSSPTSQSSILQSLAVLRMREHKDASGRELAARALVLCLENYGPDHIETARAWLTMGKLWRGTGSDPSRARIAFGRAETIILARLGAHHPMLQDVLEERADLEATLGAPDLALAYARRAEALARRTYGDKASRTKASEDRTERLRAAAAAR